MRKFVLIGIAGLLAAGELKAERYVYATPDGYTGAQARTACADGYHFASIVELYDFSSLIWDSTLGGEKSDSGKGIPIGLEAWVRSGIDGSDPALNCSGWTS